MRSADLVHNIHFTDVGFKIQPLFTLRIQHPVNPAPSSTYLPLYSVLDVAKMPD